MQIKIIIDLLRIKNSFNLNYIGILYTNGLIGVNQIIILILNTFSPFNEMD